MELSPAEVAHGPVLIGTLLNILLYGITITQVYLYHNSSKRDPRWIQQFVYFMFLGDTIHTIFTIQYSYEALITKFGDLRSLQTANWVFATDPALTGILGGLVQGFFAWRVKILSGSWAMACFITLCASLTFLMGIATAIAIGFVPEFVQFQKFKVVVILWLGCSAVADLLITFSLTSHLRKYKREINGRVDTYIDRVIRLTIQTGLLTSLWAVVDLLLYLLNPTGLHLIFNFPLSKLYTNSLMSSLNARRFWRYDDDDEETEGVSTFKATIVTRDYEAYSLPQTKRTSETVDSRLDTEKAGEV